MNRRGFTMLELTLAAMLGSVVLLAALGVFASLDRGDRVLAARAEQSTGLELASMAIENAVGTLVMDAGSQGKSPSKPDPKLAATGSAGATGSEPAAESGRPRVLLEVDATPGLPLMPDVAAASTAGAPTTGMGAGSAPQRLELVLARHPTPVETRASDLLTVAGPGGPGRGDQGQGKPMAVRGAFELRPEVRKTPEGPTTWTLWWRPIERRVNESGAEMYAGVDELAVPLARGLVACRWSVFYEEAWATTHSTAAVLDLPAYVKLQITTSAGLEADWLFEVGWTMGPEFKPPPKTEDGEVTDEETGTDESTPGGSVIESPATINPKPIKSSGTTKTVTPKPAAPQRRPGTTGTATGKSTGKSTGGGR